MIKKKSRRFIPTSFELDMTCIDKRYYRIINNGTETLLYVSPMVQTALNEIQRGRSSFYKEERLMLLTRNIKDKINPQVRGIIKKKININIKLSSVNDDKMFLVNVKISKISDHKYEILNPTKLSKNC